MRPTRPCSVNCHSSPLALHHTPPLRFGAPPNGTHWSFPPLPSYFPPVASRAISFRTGGLPQIFLAAVFLTGDFSYGGSSPIPLPSSDFSGSDRQPVSFSTLRSGPPPLSTRLTSIFWAINYRSVLRLRGFPLFWSMSLKRLFPNTRPLFPLFDYVLATLLKEVPLDLPLSDLPPQKAGKTLVFTQRKKWKASTRKRAHCERDRPSLRESPPSERTPPPESTLLPVQPLLRH